MDSQIDSVFKIRAGKVEAEQKWIVSYNLPNIYRGDDT